MGFIMIGFGIPLTFAGAKFFMYSVAVLVWAFSSMILFVITYNFLPAQSIKMGVLIGAIVVCALLGIGVAYLVFQFFKSWFIPLLAGWGGIVLAVFLGKLAGVQSSNVSLIFAVFGAIGGVVLGKYFNKHVKYGSTAFIGSYFIIRGAATWIGGFPSDFSSTAALKKIAGKAVKNNNGAVYIWGYFIAFLALFICGALFQLYWNREEDNEDMKDDMFYDQDESRVCGCF